MDAVRELWQAGRHDEARAAGITTLLAKLDGDHSQQLATLEQLIAVVDATTP